MPFRFSICPFFEQRGRCAASGLDWYEQTSQFQFRTDCAGCSLSWKMRRNHKFVFLLNHFFLQKSEIIQTITIDHVSSQAFTCQAVLIRWSGLHWGTDDPDARFVGFYQGLQRHKPYYLQWLPRVNIGTIGPHEQLYSGRINQLIAEIRSWRNLDSSRWYYDSRSIDFLWSNAAQHKYRSRGWVCGVQRLLRITSKMRLVFRLRIKAMATANDCRIIDN